MGSAEEALASQGAAKPQETEDLPSYAEASAASFATAESSASASTAAPGQSSGQHQHQHHHQPVGPTVASPFDFPSQEESPPLYSEHKRTSIHKPIAIPQAQPTPTSAFLPAYAPSLLTYGIPASSWSSFLETMSAFLQAKVSDRALAHAADIGRDLGSVPKSFGKSVASHAKSIGHNISDSAKRGDFAGAARGIIGGTISLPVATAFGAVGATLRLPGSVVSAATKKPHTPRERAEAYIAVANKDWFLPRGLDARLLDTAQLGELVGAGGGGAGEGGSSSSGGGSGRGERLVEVARSAKDSVAVRQLSTLGAYIAELEVLQSAVTLEVELKTLWLVLVQKEAEKQ